MKPKFRPRKRKTAKPAPKAEPKRDWMDQDPCGQGVGICPTEGNVLHWGWIWPFPFMTGITSPLFHHDFRTLPVSFPHPAEYTR
jgi:hypothetical protein